MKKIIGISLVALLLFCSSFDSMESKSVKIGNLEWSTTNYDGEVFSNGDTILQVNSKEEWDNAFNSGVPAWCFYKFDDSNADYGKIYNINAILSSKELAPKGWHVATYQDWNDAIDFLGGKKKAGKKMRSIDGWIDGSNGDNTSGLNCQPVGALDYSEFKSSESGTNYWSIKVKTDSYIICRFGVSWKNYPVHFQVTNKDGYGAYVRLVKN